MTPASVGAAPPLPQPAAVPVAAGTMAAPVAALGPRAAPPVVVVAGAAAVPPQRGPTGGGASPAPPPASGGGDGGGVSVGSAGAGAGGPSLGTAGGSRGTSLAPVPQAAQASVGAARPPVLVVGGGQQPPADKAPQPSAQQPSGDVVLRLPASASAASAVPACAGTVAQRGPAPVCLSADAVEQARGV